jgi:crossover junction endodeoxyribonuclease RusA
VTRQVLVLPLPPSLNNLYANGKNGGRFKTPEAEAYAHEAGWRAKEQGAQYLGKAEVVVNYRFYMNRRGDVSNRVKAVEDALTGIVWHDDRQVQRYTAERLPPMGNPRVEVEIEPISK